MREHLLIPGVGALFAAVVVGAFGLDAVTSHLEHLASAERETRNLAGLLADQVRQLVSTTDQTLKVAAHSYHEWLGDPHRSSETGYRALKSIAAGSDILDLLAWFDTEGNLIAGSEAPRPPALNIRHREHFQVHVERWDAGPFIGTPLHSDALGRRITVVSRRIEGPGGTFAGVATAILNMSYLHQALQRYHALAAVHVSLYRHGGNLIAHYPNPGSHLGHANPQTRLFGEELPKARHGTYHGLAEGSHGLVQGSGSEWVFSYETIAGHPLVVQVGMSRAIALAPWHARIRLTGVLAALAMAAIAVATALIYRQTKRLDAERLRAIEAQFAAEHASRSKSEFLAHMSHELRTPMNAVIGFTEMMSKEVFGPVGSPKYRGYLADIAMSGQHLLHVVNNVLDLAKVEAGKWEMEQESVPLRAFCLSTAQMVRERARAARITIAIDAAAPDLTLRADPRLLRQILLNLVINAIKFTEPGGRVAIGWARRGDDRAALAVRDTGVGMSPEDAKRVLEPFGRGSAYLARARHDTGLGLPLCKRFAEMHGGHMEIESELGRGTCVTVILPHARMREPPGRSLAAA